MNTRFEEVISIFLEKVSKDEEFFEYEGLLDDDIMTIINQRSESLLQSAIARLMDSCSPDVNFYDYDTTLNQFNFELFQSEKELITELMKEELLKLDEMKLKVVQGYFNTKDLKSFSPAEERKSFVSMLKDINERNNIKIASYVSKDRETGKYKTLNFDYEV